MMEGLRKPTELIVIVVTLLSYGFRFKRLCMRLAWMSGLWPVGAIGQGLIVSRSIRR